MKRDDVVGRDRLSCFFSLSYANYLTVPRSLLEAMPGAWQGGLAELLEELGDEFQWPVVGGVRIEVRLRDSSGHYVGDPLSEYRRPDRLAIELARDARRGHDRRGHPRLDVGAPLRPEDVPGRNS